MVHAMRTRLLVASIAIAVGGLMWGGSAAAQRSNPVAMPADPRLPPYRPGPPVSGTLVATTGMDSVEAMFSAWVEAFRKYNPGADISILQKDLAPEERIALGPGTDEVFSDSETKYENAYGYRPFRIRVCQAAFELKSHVSAIGVFVAKANPLNRIRLDQLDAAFSEGRRRGFPRDISRWGQLGLKGEWASKPIHLYGFYGRDDVTWYFRDMVDYGAPFKPSYTVPPKGGDVARRTPAVAAAIMDALAHDPYGIGFANFSYATGDVKPLALVDERGREARPTLTDIATGRYPLQRWIYLYVNRRPGQPLSPLVAQFMQFILSQDGQALVARDHYLPLTPAMAAHERALIDAREKL